MTSSRLSTGNSQLDQMLGGGLLPGTLTVVAGATGIGKTQLGLQWAANGRTEEGQTGILFDMTSRGDSQNHTDYAQRLADWKLREFPLVENPDPTEVWDKTRSRHDYLHVFQQSGRKVTRNDLDQDEWREWKIELTRKLQNAIQFFYGNFMQGVRRVVIDGVEPTDREVDSFQFHLFEYIYHQILHKEADWVARDLFRVHYREQEPSVLAHMYDHTKIGTLLLYTTHEVMLDDLLEKPIASGDVLSNANTIILMGKTRNGTKMGRALQIAKHRGSPCDESIVPFEITSNGLKLLSE
ncbi:MAG: recombinase RecA [Planctomycetaceae bacterium]|nr:recombinase RecA [Planctomycetaceae bacterium]